MPFVNDQIALLLERRKPNKTNVAAKIGVSRATLRSWSISTSPKVEELIKIAKVYNVPISYFFEEYESQNTLIAENGSANVINGNATINNSDVNSYLKGLIEEKERTIQILINQLNSKL